MLCNDWPDCSASVCDFSDDILSDDMDDNQPSKEVLGPSDANNAPAPSSAGAINTVSRTNTRLPVDRLPAARRLFCASAFNSAAGMSIKSGSDPVRPIPSRAASIRSSVLDIRRERASAAAGLSAAATLALRKRLPKSLVCKEPISTCLSLLGLLREHADFDARLTRYKSQSHVTKARREVGAQMAIGADCRNIRD
jgi:hypothetical protein